MKITKTSFLFILIFGPTVLCAQDCEAGADFVDMKTSRTEVRHTPSGSLWWSGIDGGFIVDDSNLSSEPVTAIFAGGLWIGGVDDGGNLKMATSTYGLGNGRADWFPGPLSSDGVATNEICINFDKVWKVDKAEVEAFRLDFEDNGMIDDPIPNSIRAWPGKDNPSSFSANGFYLPQGKKLAPFVDRNNDNIYNPMDGDYPFTRDAVSVNWWITNDNGNIHTESNGDPLKVEVSFLAYHFPTATLEPTRVFYELEITNFGAEPINDMYAGIWADPDLGCVDDDYVGCLPDKNLAFVYNADEFDGDEYNICATGSSFDAGIPAVGIRILEGLKDENSLDRGMTSFIYHNGGFGIPTPPATDVPQTPPEYYNALQGVWRDGTPLSTGGSGYSTGGEITKFAYSDLPNVAGGWSMCESNGASGDFRILMGSGPQRLDPHQSTKLAFVTIVTAELDYPCPDLSTMVVASDVAKVIYDQLPTSAHYLKKSTLVEVSPNPSTDFVNIQLNRSETIDQLRLISPNGKIIFQREKIESNIYQLNKNNLASGIYFLQVISSEGKIGEEKIVFR